MHKFSLRFWCGYLQQPKKYYNDSLSFYFDAFKHYNFDFDVSVANDIAIDVARCALPGKVMQGSPCPEVGSSTNENWCYIMKLKASCKWRNFSPL